MDWTDSRSCRTRLISPVSRNGISSSRSTNIARARRNNEMMTLVVKDLSDQDIADLAAYYAAIEVAVTPPK